LKTLPANESRGHKPSLISSLYKWLSGREASDQTFEENCARSSLREDQLTMTVAKLIIEFAKEGKREPNRLRDLVLRTCILNNRALAPA
jgi:hypothetical protein